MNTKALLIAGISFAVAGVTAKVFVDKATERTIQKVEPHIEKGETLTEEEIEKITEESVMETAEQAVKIASNGVKAISAIGVERLVYTYAVKCCPATTVPTMAIMFVTTSVISGMAITSMSKYIDDATKSMISMSSNAMEKYKSRKEEHSGESGNGKIVSGPWRNKGES